MTDDDLRRIAQTATNLQIFVARHGKGKMKQDDRMTGDQKWRAEMLVRLSQPICYETISTERTASVHRYHESPEDAVARAVETLDRILAAVDKPVCVACAAIDDTIDRLKK